MWTLGWSWKRLCCYADHVVGWRCERSVEVEHASAATLIMVPNRTCSYTHFQHGVGWGGDVNVRLQLNTPRMLRWACGGVEMWTLGWSWTRLCCYADHVVGWRCERSVEVEHASAATLIMVPNRTCSYTHFQHGVGWGGVGMWTFVCSWTRHACYAEHVVGWRCERWVEVEHASAATLIMWWGGDVNVRLKLNTPRMLRWACGGVEMWTFGWSLTRHWCYAGVGMWTYIVCSRYLFWGVHHNNL